MKDTIRKTAGGALVVIGQRGVEIARTITDRQGRYEIGDLQAGQYVVVSGNVGRVVRLWETAVAPPAARPDVALSQVDDAGAARGQLFAGLGMSTLATGAALTGAAVGVGLGLEAQDDVEHLEHENRVLKQQLQSLEETVSESLE